MKRKDKDAEALWAEVKRLTLEMSLLQQKYDERTACMIVHRGQALACSEAVRAAYFDESRRADKLWGEVGRLRAEVERLHEQLRLATVDQAIAEAEASDAHAENKRLQESLAALEQEAGRE